MSFTSPGAAEVRRRRIITAALSVLFTSIVVTGFLLESRWGYLPPPTRIVFAESWPTTRTGEDALRDRAAAKDAKTVELAESRAYIATLSGKARADAQAQYDAYVEGNGLAALSKPDR